MRFGPQSLPMLYTPIRRESLIKTEPGYSFRPVYKEERKLNRCTLLASLTRDVAIVKEWVVDVAGTVI